MFRDLVFAMGLPFGLALLPADAATVTATSLFPSSFTDFTIDFMDDGNGLLEFGEITAFSGVKLLDYGLSFDEIVRVPTIPGISSGDFPNWIFGGPTNAGVAWETWTYHTTAVNAVPIPAALPILASGLGAIGFLGWRRRSIANVSTM